MHNPAQLPGKKNNKRTCDDMGADASLPKAPRTNANKKAEDEPADVAVAVHEIGGKKVIGLRLSAPKRGKRFPVRLVCVLDVSGSMDGQVDLASQEVAGAYLTYLDFAKHAVGAVAAMLDEDDEVCVVTFSDNATVVIPWTKTNAQGKESVRDTLKTIAVEGQTNLWAGVKTGLAQHTSLPGVAEATFVFTDGAPNREPAMGNVNALLDLKRQGKIPGTLHTFGFGYNLKSEELCNMASIGGGAFGFIPDEQFMGTVLVDATASVLTTCATNVTITIMERNASLIKPIVLPHAYDSKSGTLTLHNMRYGQGIHVVMEAPLGVEVGISYSFTTQDGPQQGFLPTSDAPADPEIEYHYRRSMSAQHFSELARLGTRYWTQHGLDTFVDALTHSADPRLHALEQDWRTQVHQSVHTPDYFRRWGKHYLLSLGSAHMQQRCSNFKDAGVQVYAGDMFAEHRNHGSNIYDSLDTPTPRIPEAVHQEAQRNSTVAQAVARVVTQPVDMTEYNSRSAPCFASGSTVATPKGTVQIEALRKGGAVCAVDREGNESVGTVMCILETRLADANQDFCLLGGGLLVTPFHPVRKTLSSPWKHPKDIADIKTTPSVHAIYSILLDEEHHSVKVNNWWAATLGHRLCGDVIGHPYFGHGIVDDLKQHSRFETGLVSVQGPIKTKRGAGDLVCKMCFE